MRDIAIMHSTEISVIIEGCVWPADAPVAKFQGYLGTQDERRQALEETLAIMAPPFPSDDAQAVITAYEHPVGWRPPFDDDDLEDVPF